MDLTAAISAPHDVGGWSGHGLDDGIGKRHDLASDCWNKSLGEAPKQSGAGFPCGRWKLGPWRTGKWVLSFTKHYIDVPSNCRPKPPKKKKIISWYIRIYCVMSVPAIAVLVRPPCQYPHETPILWSTSNSSITATVTATKPQVHLLVSLASLLYFVRSTILPVVRLRLGSN